MKLFVADLWCSIGTSWFFFFFPQKINPLSQESLNDSMNVALMRVNNYALQLSLNKQTKITLTSN